MALIQVNFMSKTLMRTVPINVILPADKMTFPGMPCVFYGDEKGLCGVSEREYRQAMAWGKTHPLEPTIPLISSSLFPVN